MKKLALIVILILFVSLFLGADVYTKSVERVKEFELMGKTQKETLQMKERWYGKDKYAELGKDFSIIIDLEKEKMYFIVHEPKIYLELPTEFDGEKFFDFIMALSPKVAEVVKSIKISDAKVNLNSDTKKIANWDCTASELEMVFMIPAINMMPKFKMKMWMTHDLPENYEKVTEMGEVFIRSILGMLNIDEASQKEMDKMEKVDGFQIAADVTIEIFGARINVESQTLEVTEKPAPKGIYSIPSGYTKKDLNDIKDQLKQIPKSNQPQ
jgi:uncharacterized protein YjaG (DUF416 family)